MTTFNGSEAKGNKKGEINEFPAVNTRIFRYKMWQGISS